MTGGFYEFMLVGAIVHICIAPVDIFDIIVTATLDDDKMLACPTLIEFIHFYDERRKADWKHWKMAVRDALCCICCLEWVCDAACDLCPTIADDSEVRSLTLR